MAKHEQDDPKSLYRNGKMTRAGMVRVIEGGGSVILQGQNISKVDDLPDEATLAEGDVAAAEALNQSIDEQIATLTRQKAAAEQTRARAAEAEAKRAKAPEETAPKPDPPKSTERQIAEEEAAARKAKAEPTHHPAPPPPPKK